jgi:hypothetical protein
VTDLLQNCSSSRPGPKPDPGRAAVRALFPEWSERTFATYWKAHCQLKALDGLKGVPPGSNAGSEFGRAVKAATRPNGTLNVTRLAEIAEAKAAFWVVENFADGAEVPQ